MTDGKPVAQPDRMIDFSLFAYLAIAVALVGTWMWVRPKGGNAKNSKYSGIGDQGQYSKKS